MHPFSLMDKTEVLETSNISSTLIEGMKRKKCTGCGKIRLLKFFNRKSPTRLQSQCKTCTRASIRQHYRNNKEYYKLKSKRAKSIIAETIKTIKSQPCSDCGISYPSYVMDFDHRGDKDFEISGSSRTGSLRKILSEIAKCDLVCANCHRIRTHRRIDKAI